MPPLTFFLIFFPLRAPVRMITSFHRGIARFRARKGRDRYSGELFVAVKILFVRQSKIRFVTDGWPHAYTCHHHEHLSNVPNAMPNSVPGENTL